MYKDTTYFGDEYGMAAVVGRIEEYDDKEEWQQYVERLSFFFVANGIETAEKKRAVFLSVVGAPTYKLLRSLVSPAKPDDKTFTQLVEILSKHFKPTPSEIVERFKFHSRFRKPGESVSTFVAELRRLAEFCNFGDSLETMIRDRLVCGINDEQIQKRLLAESELSYKKAVKLASSMEEASKNVLELKGSIAKKGPEVDKTEVHRVKSASPRSAERGTFNCFHCGRPGHLKVKCRVRPDIVCSACGNTGHMRRACRSTKSAPRKDQGRRRLRQVQETEDQGGSESETGQKDGLYSVSSRKSKGTPPIVVKVEVDGKLVPMEVDTGASVTVMPVKLFESLWPGRHIDTTGVRLSGYSKEPIPVKGCCKVNIVYQGQRVDKATLIVVDSMGPALFGRDLLSRIRLNWSEIHKMTSSSLQEVLNRYSSVFGEGLGTLKGYKAKVRIDPEASPKFHRARSVPFALREKVDKELKRLEEEGTIEPVEFSDWAAPIVAVLKSDKVSVRICGDFRVTVNPVSKFEQYPIPKVEDLFIRLAKGKLFSKLDLRQAYQQICLDEESKKVMVVNTQRGLFRYTRLPFGISSAPAIFQRVIESLLRGIDGVVAYIDDILISGPTESAHLATLAAVLSRLESAGLKLKQNKCTFLQDSVTFLGHRIDANGLHPLPDKVQAIKEAPKPRSVTELKAYLGLLTYYGKFMPNMSRTLHPLYKLLRKDTAWKWEKEQDKAFKASKELLSSDECLIHFDSTLPLTLACDASAYGIGAVLAHKTPEGERPIAYVSRTLTAAEQNYSQLEKEGLACVFGVKKFHNYVFGHPFELVTDHKPLLGLLKEDRATSAHASARIKRWSLFLSSYEYTLKFRKTTEHANADALSRLPLTTTPKPEKTPPELVLLMEHLQDSPATADDIKQWTSKDPQLSKVLQYTQQGWPSESDEFLQPYAAKKLELSSYDGCVLWGSRVVIPPKGRKGVLQELHEGHPGMTVVTN